MSESKHRWIVWAAAIAIFVIAAAFRCPRLADRPMHTDEAVQAIKFTHLVEHGEYTYDPREHHGPTLYYFSLIPAWLTGQTTCESIQEATLRVVPAVAGVLLVVIAFFFLQDNRRVAILAALFTAVSGVFVYYSRYYIQESLFVLFIAAAIFFCFRFMRSGKYVCIVFAGLFTGLAFATKETFVLSFAACFVAVIVTWLLNRKETNSVSVKNVFLPLFVFFVVAVVVASLFYSSFGGNPTGVIDSVQTFSTYFERGTNNDTHQHPWYWYFKLLFCFHQPSGPIWSEVAIIFFACVGIGAAFFCKTKTKPFLQFLSVYAIVLAIIYSLIPYKTPWCVLTFYWPCLILAGFGADVLYGFSSAKLQKFFVAVTIGLGVVSLGLQAGLSAFVFSSDPVNPWVYAHTSEDVFFIEQKICSLAQRTGEGENLYMQIIAPEDDYWPLPWYLRDFHRIGYYNHVPMDAKPAPVIVVHDEMHSDLLEWLYEKQPPGERSLYATVFERLFLRPGVELRCYAENDFLNRINSVSVEDVQLKVRDNE